MKGSGEFDPYVLILCLPTDFSYQRIDFVKNSAKVKVHDLVKKLPEGNKNQRRDKEDAFYEDLSYYDYLMPIRLSTNYIIDKSIDKGNHYKERIEII